MSTSNFSDACGVYRMLREKGYPEKATLKLVGDRHRLSRIQRNCLFRGVIPEATARRRKARLVTSADVSGQELALDWYNVLITVESYLRGEILFLSDDGVVRDASATHGSYRTGPTTERAMQEVLRSISDLLPARVDAYLDHPIAFSGQMAEELRRGLSHLACPVRTTLEASADFPLKSSTAVVATSDSAVLDSARRGFDLAARVLEVRFGFSPLPVQDLFAESPG